MLTVRINGNGITIAPGPGFPESSLKCMPLPLVDGIANNADFVVFAEYFKCRISAAVINDNDVVRVAEHIVNHCTQEGSVIIRRNNNTALLFLKQGFKIGRASCRERV